MTARWRALVVGFAALVPLLLTPAPAAACTGCAATLDDFLPATQSIALAQWEHRAGGKDTFRVLDVLRGPAIREVTLYSEYLKGKTPQGRWLLFDQGYLGLLRVSASGAVARGFTGDTPGTLAGWYAAIRRMPDTAAASSAASPSPTVATPPALLLVLGAGAFAIGWRRSSRGRRRSRGRGSPRLAFGLLIALVGLQAGAPESPANAAAMPAAPTEPSRIAAPTADRRTADATTTPMAAGDVTCTALTMHEQRDTAIQVALADGGALVLGGYDPVKFWDDNAHLVPTWEVFEPSLDAFVKGGRIPGEAWPYIATLLADGRVLLLSAQAPMLFDPATKSFSTAGHPVRLARYEFAVRLQDGRVLVAGQSDRDSWAPLVEIFNPRTRTWSVTGSMHTVRFDSGVALLPDGRVLVAGGDLGVGESALNIMHSSAEIYDPVRGVFVGARPMSRERFDFAAVALADGRVLVSGDAGDNSVTSEIYDPQTGRYSRTGSMLDVPAEHAVRLQDGRVLFVEEANEDDSYFDLGPEDAPPPNIPSPSQVYDPAAGRFVELRLMNPFLSFSLTVLRDGRALILDDSDAALVCSP